MNHGQRRQRPRWQWALLLIAVLAAIAFAIAWRPAIAPGSGTSNFASASIERGARLAAIGTCGTCHTADPAAPYAGGVPMQTPFGILYSTNITPDAKTGIGSYTEEAFARALREGVARNGRHLYPAFPYDHYTLLTDADIRDLYAFIMTRDPIEAPAHENRLRFPFGFRPLLAGWKLLYLDKKAHEPQSSKDAAWNRGAYLVDALAHCGACHTPRNALGAEQPRHYLGGGEAENWYVPALNADSPSPLPWTVDQLTTYLRTGIAIDHAAAGGPMQDVVASLARANEADVRSIAVYIHSLLKTPSTQTQENAIVGARQARVRSLPPAPAGDTPAQRQLQLGATVYAGACARCHDRGRAASSGAALQLPAAVAVYDPDPRSLIHIIRDGIRPPAAEPGRWMPGFGDSLTDEQVEALAAYLRHSAARLPAWPELKGAVQKAKSQ
jgi:mono/diheme cytochrome c family protein